MTFEYIHALIMEVFPGVFVTIAPRAILSALGVAVHFSFRVRSNAISTALMPPASFPMITAGSISGAKPAVKPR